MSSTCSNASRRSRRSRFCAQATPCACTSRSLKERVSASRSSRGWSSRSTAPPGCTPASLCAACRTASVSSAPSWCTRRASTGSTCWRHGDVRRAKLLLPAGKGGQARPHQGAREPIGGAGMVSRRERPPSRATRSSSTTRSSTARLADRDEEPVEVIAAQPAEHEAVEVAAAEGESDNG